MKAQRTSLRLRVIPGSRRSGVVGRHGEAWKVRVTASPESGNANEAVLALLSDTLDLPRAQLELTAGRASRNKVVALDGLSPDVVVARLSAAAGER